jgi:hypothetical protein
MVRRQEKAAGGKGSTLYPPLQIFTVVIYCYPVLVTWQHCFKVRFWDHVIFVLAQISFDELTYLHIIVLGVLYNFKQAT